MCSKITDDVIDALQHCRLKAYFQLRGEQSTLSEYEKLLIEQRADLRHKTIEKFGGTTAKSKRRLISVYRWSAFGKEFHLFLVLVLKTISMQSTLTRFVRSMVLRF